VGDESSLERKIGPPGAPEETGVPDSHQKDLREFKAQQEAAELGRVQTVIDQAMEELRPDPGGERSEYRVPRSRSGTLRRRALMLAAAALAAFASSAAYNYVRAVGAERELHLTRAELESSAGSYLFHVALRLERFRMEQGVYPEELARIGNVHDPSLTYQLHSDTQYTLVYRVDGQTHTYTSSQPLSELVGR
jgi:hypothetical protein